MKDETSNRRRLKISVLRFNPQEAGSVPRLQTYEIDEAEGMTLFIALNHLDANPHRVTGGDGGDMGILFNFN